MSAAVWNEPRDPELRRRGPCRPADASRDNDRNTSVLMTVFPGPRRPVESETPRYAVEPRPAETTA